jgi:hypothetical protein
MARRMRTLATLFIAAMMVVAGCSRSADPPPEAKTIAIIEPTDSMTVDETPADKVDAAPPAEQGQFSFPNDTGGRALAKTLVPATPAPMPAGAQATPRERRLPPIHEAPLPTPPVALGPPPRLSIPATKELRPVALPERVPQSLGGLLPDLPPRGDLSTGPLVRQDSRDIAKPAELPILSAKPVADRAPLTDPTLEFTAGSVVSPSLPLRITPAGFIRIPVPDPFEHADAAKPRTSVVEDPNRSLGNPPPPRQ